MKTSRKIILNLVCMLFLGITLSCSDKIYTSNEVDEVATFPFGQDSLTNFLNKNIRWVNNMACGSGYILVGFTVDQQGYIHNIKIIKEMFFPPFDKEAIRLVELMPNWIPAKKNNKNVCSEVELPIRFAIEGYD